MEGEYLENKNESTAMFSKLPQHHQHPQHQQQLHLFASNPFQLSRECQNSEEDDSRSSGGPTGMVIPARKIKQSEPPSTGDGSSIEVLVRRPRGRPPGSKNKPKPPVIITREMEPAMTPCILEVPGGSDVVEAIARFCGRNNMGLCVLNGSGSVANVTLRQPSTTPGATITFHGRFDILSISATFVPQQTPSFPALPNSFTISLAGPQGQIVGGFVAGGLMAAGTVFVIAASFNNPLYHRLPSDEETRASVSQGEGGVDISPPVSGGGGESGHGPADSCGMSIYSCHLPSTDVIWAPTARENLLYLLTDS